MKELTIEQKAKAYDEAAERALKLKVQNPFDTVGQMMEYVFPELAESDDEKIRKEILDYIDKATGCKRWVAWLEKQGECETDCHRSHQDANHPNGCIVLEDFNGGEGFYKVHLDYLSKKQVEVVEEMVRTWNNDSKVPDEDIKSCIGMCLTDAHEQRFKDYNTSLKDCLAWLEKQVPVDEDEIVKGIRRGVAISLMNHIDANSKGMCLSNMECEDIENAIVNEDWNKVYGYMKKKLEKQGEQMSAWSEEDEKAINDIMWIIEAYRENGFNETHIQMADSSEKWLKSLKERHTWKPSDEQVDALNAINATGGISYVEQGQELINLFNDLKKLKEK